MKSHAIKQIAIDDLHKTLSILTFGNDELVIGFRRGIYFDLVCFFARRKINAPENDESFSKLFRDLTTELKNRLESFDEMGKKAYAYKGEVGKRASWARIWAQDFTIQRRQHVIIESKSPDLDENDVKLTLRNLFRYEGRAEKTIFWLGTNRIVLRKSIFLDSKTVPELKTPLGTKDLECVPLIVDTDDGFGPEDIIPTILKDRTQIPPELEEERRAIFRAYNLAIKNQEEHPWPGPIYGIDDFEEMPRQPITEKPRVHIKLRPTDYFTFMAVQRSLDKQIFQNKGGQQHQTLREKYLRNLVPQRIVPECAQSISATVILVCKDDSGKEWVLIPQRSSRKMLATGRDFLVLSINETPKRRPTKTELELLGKVPRKKIKPDPVSAGGPFFHAVVRGANEELGIDLPIESIKFTCLNMEPLRYQFAFVGIADTDLETRYVDTCLPHAKDRRLEYKGMEWVRFTPESIYHYMATHNPWGSEAEIGLYQALLYKHRSDPDRVKRLFKDYPKPLSEIPRGAVVKRVTL